MAYTVAIQSPLWPVFPGESRDLALCCSHGVRTVVALVSELLLCATGNTLEVRHDAQAMYSILCVVRPFGCILTMILLILCSGVLLCDLRIVVGYFSFLSNNVIQQKKKPRYRTQLLNFLLVNCRSLANKRNPREKKTTEKKKGRLFKNAKNKTWYRVDPIYSMHIKLG